LSYCTAVPHGIKKRRRAEAQMQTDFVEFVRDELVPELVIMMVAEVHSVVIMDNRSIHFRC
jgi:hypothetical protein